jgi:hypothetical protein
MTAITSLAVSWRSKYSAEALRQGLVVRSLNDIMIDAVEPAGTTPPRAINEICG